MPYLLYAQQLDCLLDVRFPDKLGELSQHGGLRLLVAFDVMEGSEEHVELRIERHVRTDTDSEVCAHTYAHESTHTQISWMLMFW